MNLFAQVAHVVWKDLRAQRLFIAGFVGIVFIAATRTLVRISKVAPDDADLWSTNDLFGSLFILMLGVLIVISLVRLDSPLDAREHWASTPINAKAVWGGKLATTLFAVVLVLGIAQFVVLRAMQVGVDESASFVGMSSLSVTSNLAAAALLAAVMPTIQRCLVAWMLLSVFGVVVGFSPIGTGVPEPAATFWHLFMAASVVVAKVFLLLVLFTHRWSEKRVRWFVVASLIVLPVAQSAILTMVKSVGEPERVPSVVATPNSVLATMDSQTLTIRFALRRPTATQRIVLVNPVLKLRMADGTVLAPLGAVSRERSQFDNSQPRVEVPFYTRESPYVQNVDLRGDSIFVGLRYPMGESLGEKRKLPVAAAEFTAFLEMQEGVVIQDLKIDEQNAPANGTQTAVARTSNDAETLFQIEVRVLGSNGRLATGFIDISTGTASSVVFMARNAGDTGDAYPVAPDAVTYLLMGRGESDTLPLVTRGARSSESQLPIPFTHVYKASVGLAPLNGRTGFDPSHWSGARILVKRWRYASHASLHANVTVQ